MRVRSLHLLGAASAAFLLITLAQPAPLAAQGVIFVTSLEDKVNGIGGCSLQEAIYAANRDDSMAVTSYGPDGSPNMVTTQCLSGQGDHNRIILPVQAVFQLNQVVLDASNPFGATATPMVTSNITIEANGSTLQWIGSKSARAFTVASTGKLTLLDVYIRDFHVKGGDGGSGGGGGLGAGGAIYVKGDGSLDVERSTFSGNRATGGNGAGNAFGGGGGGLGGNGGSGPTGVISSAFGGGGGGAIGDGAGHSSGLIGIGGGGTIYAPGVIILDKQLPSIFQGGFKCGGEGGGGDHEDGFDALCAGGGGGGGNSGVLLAGTGGNGSYGGGGGGGGQTANGDRADGGKGGFGGGGGAGWQDDFGSCGSGSSGGDGGFGGGGGAGPGGQFFGGAGHGGIFGGSATCANGGGGAALGGAIFNDGGTVVITNSTFSGNAVLRGKGGTAAQLPADNGSDAGGAIFSLHGSLTVQNSTVSGNLGSGFSAGIAVVQIPIVFGAIVFFPPTSFTLDNTIVANNGNQECAVSGASISVSGAGNLVESNFGCPQVVSSADPLLGPLQINQSFMPILAIGKNSPAWNTADPNTSLASDQRGQTRPQMGGFDIGAFELCVDKFLNPCQLPPVTAIPNKLIVEINPAGAGTTTPPVGETDVFPNAVQTLTATPNAGYSFLNWTGNVADPSNQATAVIMTQDQSVTANFIPCSCAGNVSTATSIKRLGFVLNLATKRYAQTVTVTNTSVHPITGPISLVLDSLSSNATLFNATGTTDSLEAPAGSPYLNANVSLGPGQSVAFALQFTDPANTAITYNTRVLAGPGAR